MREKSYLKFPLHPKKCRCRNRPENWKLKRAWIGRRWLRSGILTVPLQSDFVLNWASGPFMAERRPKRPNIFSAELKPQFLNCWLSKSLMLGGIANQLKVVRTFISLQAIISNEKSIKKHKRGYLSNLQLKSPSRHVPLIYKYQAKLSVRVLGFIKILLTTTLSLFSVWRLRLRFPAKNFFRGERSLAFSWFFFFLWIWLVSMWFLEKKISFVTIVFSLFCNLYLLDLIL